jgi:hypothetical protein
MKNFLLIILSFTFTGVFGQDLPFTGTWDMVKAQSTTIDHFAALQIDLIQNDKQISLIRKWGAGSKSFIDTLTFRLNGSSEKVLIGNRLFPTNVFMAISAQPGAHKQLKSKYDPAGKVLTITEKIPVLVSQGKAEIENTHTLQFRCRQGYHYL